MSQQDTTHKRYQIEEIRLYGVPEIRIWSIEAIIAPFVGDDFHWKLKRDGLLVSRSFDISLTSLEWYTGSLAEQAWDALKACCRVSVKAREILERGRFGPSATYSRDETDFRVYEATRAFLRRAAPAPMSPTHVATITSGGEVAAAWPAYSQEDALRILRLWYAGRRAADYLNNQDTFKTEEEAGRKDPIEAEVEDISAWYADGSDDTYVEIVELSAEDPMTRELKEHAGFPEDEKTVREAIERVQRAYDQKEGT